MRFLLLTLSFLTLFGAELSAGSLSLNELVAQIRNDYSGITHTSPQVLADELKKNPSGFVLFDVREQNEYNISHIPGALRVDPRISSEKFTAEFVSKIRDRKVVFYCSVGIRSSRLATRVRQTLSTLGALDVINLAGGIFQWHGLGYELVNAGGRTEYVHPYDRYWGQMISRKELISEKH